MDEDIISMVMAIDSAIDAIEDALTTGNFDLVTSLVNVADEAVDGLMAALGLSDPDEDVDPQKAKYETASAARSYLRKLQ